MEDSDSDEGTSPLDDDTSAVQRLLLYMTRSEPSCSYIEFDLSSTGYACLEVPTLGQTELLPNGFTFPRRSTCAPPP